jgi:WD40 repeat protein
MIGQRWWAGLPALFFLAGPALGQQTQITALYDRPTLVLDPGMHTARIIRADVDAAGRYAVTGSEDKTVRVWSVETGGLERTIRLPAGPGDVGKVYAVAISPDGEVIAAGGWTTGVAGQEKIYLFDRATGGTSRQCSLARTGSAATTVKRAGPRSPATPNIAAAATAPISRPMDG